jgi:hypothetical protein
MSGRRTLGAAVAVGLCALVGGPAAAPASVELRPDLRPGDAVTVGGLSVTVPAAGGWASTTALTASGDDPSLTVTTDEDGAVAVTSALLEEGGQGLGPADELMPQTTPESPVMLETQEPPPLVGGALATASAPGPCEDGAYNLGWFYFADGSKKHFKWKTTFGWRYNSGSTPSEVGATAAADAIQRATTNITSQDGCGLADEVGATHSYNGTTSNGVNYSAGCLGGDGQSVVAFGDLRPSWYGVTCTWGVKDPGQTYAQATESDAKLNKNDYKWYATKPSPCSGKLSIEAGMTHERGHTFGLGHVGEEQHGLLTMSPIIEGFCQDSESSLGWGDIRGLRKLY